jgi:hypothetical protein
MYWLHDTFYFSLSQNFPNSWHPSVLHREYKTTVVDPTVKGLDSSYNTRLPFLGYNLILFSDPLPRISSILNTTQKK